MVCLMEPYFLGLIAGFAVEFIDALVWLTKNYATDRPCMVCGRPENESSSEMNHFDNQRSQPTAPTEDR